MSWVPPIKKRLVEGSPLTSQEMDDNLDILKNSINGLAQKLGVALNPDGSIKENAVTPAKLSPAAFWYYADTGSANSYAIAPSPALSAYADGVMVAVRIANKCTGTSTLNVNSLGAKKIFKIGGLKELESGDLQSGQISEFRYDSALNGGSGGWHLLSYLGNPIGIGFGDAKQYLRMDDAGTYIRWDDLPTANFVPTYQAEITLASGLTSTTAWVTLDLSVLAPGFPSTYRFVMLRIIGQSRDNRSKILLRKDSGSDTIVGHSQKGESNDGIQSQTNIFMPVTDTLTFDYQVNIAYQDNGARIIAVGYVE